MNSKYNIKAIPTKYNGVSYRSRLEATWACFFDKINWGHEYEPFDLEGWTPDFHIKTTLGQDILIEIKPKFLINNSLYFKIAKASNYSDSVAILHENPFSSSDWFMGVCGIMPRYTNNEIDDYCSASIVDIDGKTALFNLCTSDDEILDLASYESSNYRLLWNEAKKETSFLKSFLD